MAGSAGLDKACGQVTGSAIIPLVGLLLSLTYHGCDPHAARIMESHAVSL